MTDLESQRFGRLTVLGLYEIVEYKSTNNHQTKARWVCECDCGNNKIVRGEHLTQHKITSCGCLAREMASKRMKTFALKHGLSKTPEYRSYASMIARVLRPDSHHKKYYSDVTICDRWLGEDGFSNFLKDIGPKPTPKHSIDRIDCSGNYGPSNCRWATHSEQMYNTRKNSRLREVYNSLDSAVDYRTFRRRITISGWNVDRAAHSKKMLNQFG